MKCMWFKVKQGLKYLSKYVRPVNDMKGIAMTPKVSNLRRE